MFVTTFTAFARSSGDELYVAAAMMESKFKSQQAVLEALTGDEYPANVTVQCKETNQVRQCMHDFVPGLASVSKLMFIHLWHVHHHQEAFDWVWNSLLPEQQKQRFMTRNISVDFLDDVFAVTGPDWLESNLVFDFNGENVNTYT